VTSSTAPAATKVASRPRRCRGDDGATFITLVVATGFVLVLLTGMIQVIVFQYGKGAVRAALDEAARSAARSPATVETCQARAANALGDLLGGDMGDGVNVSCRDAGDHVVVTATVHFDGWFGALTDYDATLTASATKEDR
jgi:Flp pilus assembly protein TadG